MVGKTKRKRWDGDPVVPLAERTRDSTLVTPASQMKCLHAGLMEELRAVTRECNKAAYFGAFLANAHVTRCFQEGLPMPPVDTDFFYLCICLVCSNKTAPTTRKASECGLDVTYSLLWEDAPYLAEVNNPGVIPQYAAINMAAVAGNYNSIAIFDHMVPYIQSKYGVQLKGHAKFLCGRITNEHTPFDFDSVPDTLDLQPEVIYGIIREEHRIFFNAYHNEALFEYRHYMLSIIRENANDERNARGFTMLPVRNIGVKFVDLDKLTMEKVWCRLMPCRKNKKGITEAETEAWNAWNAVLEASTGMESWLTYPKKNGWTPGKIVRTNGYEFHHAFEKNKARGAKRAKKVPKAMQVWPQDWDPSYTFKNTKSLKDVRVKDPTNFVACDVGHHNIMTGVSPTGLTLKNGSPQMEVRNYTKQRFNHESKRNKVNRKVARLQKNVRVQEALNQLAEHTLKTPDFEELCEAIRVRTKHYDLIYNHYANKQFLKLKAEARMAEVSALDGLVNWISYGGRKPVGIGDCAKTSGFRGLSAGGPTKKIRRLFIKRGLDATLVAEGYTSKRSCCCRGHDMVPVRVMVDGQRTDLHGLRICQGCRKTWNRDVSAAINIFDIFYNSQVRGGERPPHLVKTFRTRPTGTWFDTWC